MLKQTSYTSEIVNNQVHNIGTHLITNQTIIEAMYNKNIDRLEEYQVLEELSGIQSTYPFVQYIGIYNGYTDRYMNNKGITREAESEILDNIESNTVRQFNSLFPRKVGSLTRSQPFNVLSFVLVPGYNSYFPKNGAIVINVDVEYIQNLTASLKYEGADDLLVIDTEGIILTQNEEYNFLESVLKEPYFKQMTDSNQQSGNFRTNVDGESYLVSYVKADDLNWYFVSKKTIQGTASEFK